MDSHCHTYRECPIEYEAANCTWCWADYLTEDSQ